MPTVTANSKPGVHMTCQQHKCRRIGGPLPAREGPTHVAAPACQQQSACPMQRPPSTNLKKDMSTRPAAAGCADASGGRCTTG